MEKQYKYYKGKINYHRLDDLRTESLPNGSEVHLQAMGVADDGTKYEGEMIYQTAEGYLWIPERDVEILKEITFDEYVDKKYS